jgi:hypothetical protein
MGQWWNPNWRPMDWYHTDRIYYTPQQQWLTGRVDVVRLMSQNRGDQWDYCSSLGWYVSMESHANDDASWEKSWLVHQSSPTSRDISYRVGGMGNGRMSEVFNINMSTDLLTFNKILRQGTSGFTSHPKEGVLWIVIAFKIHRLGRVLTPWGH